jgi:hypothetical protein
MSEEASLNKVDSEIALTALLSAAVMGYPTPNLSLYPAVRVVAVGLLVLTLARRTGIVNGLTDDDAVIRATTYLMDPATYISFLYLSHVLIGWAANTTILDSEPSAAVFGGGTAVLVFAVFCTSELLFGAALREGERVFSATARHHRGEVFGEVLSQVAAFVGSRRQTKPTRQAKLGRFYDRTIEDYSWDEQVQVTKSFLVMLFSLFIPVVGYGLLAAVGIHVFAVGWMTALLLLLSVLLTSAFFRLWYSNYGLVQVEDRNGYVTFLGEVATFLVVGQIVV